MEMITDIIGSPDLKNKYDRLDAITALNKSFKNSLIENNIEISDENSTIISVRNQSIDIFVEQCRTITLYVNSPILEPDNKTVTINFGTSGKFTPENKISYWKTITAASMLKNWEFIVRETLHYCDLYSQLEKLIEEIIKYNN